METAVERSGPLVGLRVVELGGIGPVPFAGMLLADLGADVVRIERPGGGRNSPEPRFEVMYRGRRSVGVDLKSANGAALVLDLMARADAVIEGFRPSVAERWGLGPDAALQRNPRLVYGRMTGWGQDGPLAHQAGHDINYIARTGLLHATGRAGAAPTVPLNIGGDFGGGGLMLAFGVLAGCLEARASGRGQVIDAAMIDGASLLISMVYGLYAEGGWRDERGVNLVDSGAPFYDVYETADGRWMAVGALEDTFYHNLIRVLGLADRGGRHDRANWPQLRADLAEAFATRTQGEWEKLFDGAEACVAPVRSLSEAPHDPQLRARAVFEEIAGVVQPAPAPRFSRTPGRVAAPPPRPGQHTLDVMADWLGADTAAMSTGDYFYQAGA